MATQTLAADLVANRETVCILGLPIDLMTMQEVVERIHLAAQTREKCFISTPNLNFLVNARKDPSFRASVLQSQLSLADGVSLVAAARLMGVKLPSRVSGADLFVALCEHKTANPLRVFFLGGPPDAARKAHDAVNRQNGGVLCVGHDEAGFGDIASMSSDALIQKINAARPDFVVVSLGAMKGQAWIMHNRHRLDAPVISHLGAVVNFTAGTVRRAPQWMQRFGLEWLWRASTEPGLYKRYRDDALVLLRLMVSKHLLNAAQELAHRARQHQPATIRSLASAWPRAQLLEISGHLGKDQVPLLTRELHKRPDTLMLEVDASCLTWLDPYAIGALVRRHGELLNAGGEGLRIRSATPELKRHLERHEADYLLD